MVGIGCTRTSSALLHELWSKLVEKGVIQGLIEGTTVGVIEGMECRL